ncbi:hypothetical protein CRUP_025411 [Coryphaenoides rupestris]|nr:hypothetical protein CRUP_025411 [Coryphaenoides rupestris]
MAVLDASDAVEQLVLRNTDLTDDLLLSLARALRRSPSHVTMLNLNLNLIGPYGAHVLLDLLRDKPQVTGLHLFGNKLRDHGVQVLVSGIAALQEQTAADAAAAHQEALLLLQAQQQQQQQQQRVDPELLLQAEEVQSSSSGPRRRSGPELLLLLGAGPPAGWGSPVRIFTLLELDVGGNGLASDGLRLLAAYMRRHSFLRYLGLARTAGADLAAWKELFDSLKENSCLAHIVLDESDLGDPGVRLLADALKVTGGLRRVDLDGNDIGDVGGNDLMAALLCRTQENNISAGLMRRIQEGESPVVPPDPDTNPRQAVHPEETQIVHRG